MITSFILSELGEDHYEILDGTGNNRSTTMNLSISFELRSMNY